MCVESSTFLLQSFCGAIQFFIVTKAVTSFTVVHLTTAVLIFNVDVCRDKKLYYSLTSEHTQLPVSC